mmetsp:Transcript_2593/g.4899  ORF Transcript_2593/g.4899 Transcript_2593/m.4899 type:complete len:257 (+) Transcript_2593:281-1051(+)
MHTQRHLHALHYCILGIILEDVVYNVAAVEINAGGAYILHSQGRGLAPCTAGLGRLEVHGVRHVGPGAAELRQTKPLLHLLHQRLVSLCANFSHRSLQHVLVAPHPAEPLSNHAGGPESAVRLLKLPSLPRHFEPFVSPLEDSSGHLPHNLQHRLFSHQAEHIHVPRVSHHQPHEDSEPLADQPHVLEHDYWQPAEQLREVLVDELVGCRRGLPGGTPPDALLEERLEDAGGEGRHTPRLVRVGCTWRLLLPREAQ